MSERVPSHADHLSLPLSRSSSALHRQASASSSRSGSNDGKKNGSTVVPSTTTSSGSASKAGSFMSTPRLLSRRNSAREGSRPPSYLMRKLSGKGKAKEIDTQLEEPLGSGNELDEPNVIETPSLHIDRDPSTGRKMINQYLVLQEIGYGTHGRVRLGRDMSSEPVVEEGEEDLVPDSGTGVYYAIKIVDRNPKRKRLAGFNRNKGKNDGGKLINEIEIRKEIAIFKKVNHPNVVRMKEIIDDPDSSKLFMILEYCDGGELKWKDRFGQPYLSLDETRKIFRDTLLGLAYLHHQGIIHRDIKPSNLLFSGNGIVKISDFGCSHYSEALHTASALAGPEGEDYVDDIELAKTAGSPAFFAPEMCYTGFETELSPRNSRSPQGTPIQELPAFTLRPPSLISEVGEMRGGASDAVGMSPSSRTFPLVPTTSNDSGLSRRPLNQRTRSSITVQRQPRHPITNAIDVWALGVTLYCLLFGKTPFDAPNEYLLMQVIPTANYEIPPTLGSDDLPTTNGSLEVQDCLDLLRRLLEKDPTKRITLEQAKKHPFTLTGIEDPSAWLASTDPHAQTFVTVSNDEVAAAVTKSTSFRDRFRKGIKSISHKLHIFGTGRNRSRSIGEGDSGHTSGTSGKSSTATSHTNLVAQNKRVISREGSPLTSPSLGGSAPRRFSAFGARPEIPSPRRSSVQLAALPAPEMTSRSVSSQSAQQGLQKGFVVHRPQTHLPGPTLVNLSDSSTKRPIARTAASTGSLDQLRNVETSPRRGKVEPHKRLERRESGDSNNSSGFGYRLFSKLSLRSRSRTHLTSDPEDVPLGTRQQGSIEATSTIGSGGRPSIDSVSTDPHPSVWPQRVEGFTRRGSALSEDMFRPPVQEEVEQEPKDDDVDWDGEMSDGDEYADPPGVSVAPNLDPIPDISPIMIASPPRHSSPRGQERLSHSSASPSSSWLHRDRTRSPLGDQLRYGQSSIVDHQADEGLSYVSRRSRKGSILSSNSDKQHVR